MIIVHHLNNSRSQRVLWLLEEIGVSYQIKHYQRTEANRAPPELLAVHPLGKAPIISDGDQVIAESGAIVDYLVRTYAPTLHPGSAEPDFMRHTYWMHFAEGTAMPWLVLKLFTTLLGEAGGALAPLIDEQIERFLEFVSDEMGDHPFIAGNQLRAADFMMVFPLEAAASRGFLERHPRLISYLKLIHQRPAYQRGLERGGPYAFVDGNN